MMRWLIGAVAWVYHFLAEDFVLLMGTAIAIGAVVLAVHTVRNAAGILLYGIVVIVIATSLWRAASAGKS